MTGSASELLTYYPYWDRVIYGLFLSALIVSVELLAIIWLLLLIWEALRARVSGRSGEDE